MKKILFIAIVFCSLFGTSVLNTLAAVGDGGVARGRFQYNETNSILTARAFQSTIEECHGPRVGNADIFRVRFPVDNIMIFKEPGTDDVPMIFRRIGSGTGIYGRWIGLGDDIENDGVLILNEDGRFIYLANSCHGEITGTYSGTSSGGGGGHFNITLNSDGSLSLQDVDGTTGTGIYSYSETTISMEITLSSDTFISISGTISGDTISGFYWDTYGGSGTFSMVKTDSSGITGTYITQDAQMAILYADNTFYATEQNGDPDTGIYYVSGNTIIFTINEPGYVHYAIATILGDTITGSWYDSDGDSGTWSMTKVSD